MSGQRNSTISADELIMVPLNNASGQADQARPKESDIDLQPQLSTEIQEDSPAKEAMEKTYIYSTDAVVKSPPHVTCV